MVKAFKTYVASIPGAIPELTQEELEQKVAELLHEKLCHFNHTDGCDWHYWSWENDKFGTRKRYMTKAKKLLSHGFTLVQVQEFFDCIK
jgi:hypothetical protein